MHGRLKVRSTEEQKLLKQKEQQKKLLAYREGMKVINATRTHKPYNKQSLEICSQILSNNPDIYTLWNYRKEVSLQALEISNGKEDLQETVTDQESKDLMPSKIIKQVQALHNWFKSIDTASQQIPLNLLDIFNITDMENLSEKILQWFQTTFDQEASPEGRLNHFMQVSYVLCVLILQAWDNHWENVTDQIPGQWMMVENELKGFLKYVEQHHWKDIMDTGINDTLNGIISCVEKLRASFSNDDNHDLQLVKLLVHLLDGSMCWSFCYFLHRELQLTEQCLFANPKSYGAWHHRFWVLKHHPRPNWDREFKMVTKYLTMDDRNFHVWDYRRLILKKLGYDLESEIRFSTDRINVNFSNYSSWHYRSTLKELDAGSLEKELQLVQNAVFTDPYDSSTWFYLRWVLSNKAVTDDHRKALLNDFEQLLELEPKCKWIYMAKCWIKGSLSLSNKDEVKENIDVYKKLIELDPIRKGIYQDYVKLAE